MKKLDIRSIRKSINRDFIDSLDTLEILDSVDSTNNYLLDKTCPELGRYKVVLTDNRTNGRGRHGRIWCSPRFSGIAISVAYTFVNQPENYAPLSLAVGVLVAKTLQDLGTQKLTLKWPNDIIFEDNKLAGILIERSIRNRFSKTVIVGIGINYNLTGVKGNFQELLNSTDIFSCCDVLPSRDLLCGSILNYIFLALKKFDSQGFKVFINDWNELNYLQGKDISVKSEERVINGICKGVSLDGELIIFSNSKNHNICSGTIVNVK